VTGSRRAPPKKRLEGFVGAVRARRSAAPALRPESGSSACRSGRLIRKRSENTSCSSRSRSWAPSARRPGWRSSAPHSSTRNRGERRDPRSIAPDEAAPERPMTAPGDLVLPTPPFASRKQGRPILSARKSTVASDRSARYRPREQIERGIDRGGQRTRVGSSRRVIARHWPGLSCKNATCPAFKDQIRSQPPTARKQRQSSCRRHRPARHTPMRCARYSALPWMSLPCRRRHGLPSSDFAPKRS